MEPLQNKCGIHWQIQRLQINATRFTETMMWPHEIIKCILVAIMGDAFTVMILGVDINVQNRLYTVL